MKPLYVILYASRVVGINGIETLKIQEACVLKRFEA